MRNRSRRRSNGSNGITLVEILVGALLLSMSVAALTQLWGVSRRTTERSRDAAEVYVVARQEAERDKAILFKYLFVASGNVTGMTRRTDYTEKGEVLATGLAANAAPTDLAGPPAVKTFYRAESVYSLVATGTETLNNHKLGVQKIRVYRRDGAGFVVTAVYETTVFYTAPGV